MLYWTGHNDGIGCNDLKRQIYYFLALAFLLGPEIQAQENFRVQAGSGLKMEVEKENWQPSLRIILPDAELPENSIMILFPEHVTVRRHGQADAEHLYLYRPGKTGEKTKWRKVNNTLEYQRSFNGGLHMTAKATLHENGVSFEYTFTNNSEINYDMVTAVTDPRITSIFYSAPNFY